MWTGKGGVDLPGRTLLFFLFLSLSLAAVMVIAQLPVGGNCGYWGSIYCHQQVEDSIPLSTERLLPMGPFSAVLGVAFCVELEEAGHC